MGDIYLKMDESLPVSASPIITMMQPAESLMREDATGGYGASSSGRRCLPESKMRAVLIVIADVFREQTFQMAFIHRNDLVQQVPSAAFHPTLRDAVLPRTFKRRRDRPHLQGPNRRGNLESVFPIPVKDQKPGSRLERKRFPQLLDGPQAGRVLGHVEVRDAPTVVANDEKAIEHSESDRGDGEEIHCGDRSPMVSQKREPTLGWFGISRRPAHPAGNGSLRDIKTEHEEFAVDARCAPRWILNNHPEDQLPNLHRCLSSSNPHPNSGDQPPIRTKTRPVPADHRLRRDHDERLFPLRPKSTGGDPEKLVKAAEAGPRAASLQDEELLAEHEVLKYKIPTATEEADEHTESEEENVEHGPELQQIGFQATVASC
jgi:hypothetical protein